MRFAKITGFFIAIIVLQTVVFSRLSFYGIAPDLVLISIIIFAATAGRTSATLFSAGLAFLQDLLSYSNYINTAVKIIVSNIVSGVKDEFIGDESRLIYGLVAVITPAVIMLNSALFYLISNKEISPVYLALNLLGTTAYNLVLTVLLLPVLRNIADGK